MIAAAQLMVVLPDARDTLVLRHMDLMQAVRDGSANYLLVTSLAPTAFARGRRYMYQIEAQSRSGGVQYNLESGPPGMKISGGGLLQWSVPSDYSGTSETVIVGISDNVGTKREHIFTIQPE